MNLADIKTIDGVPVKFIGILEDDGLNECMRCGHKSATHAEFEVEGADEAEVVCPNCGSPAYFVKE
jgi:DNA-directed RNA polymerase subunit RPC12/RpoP